MNVTGFSSRGWHIAGFEELPCQFSKIFCCVRTYGPWFLIQETILLIQMRIIVTFLCANSDVNYNYILVSKDVLQLSGKEVGLSCERVTALVSRGITYSWELNCTSSSRTRTVGGWQQDPITRVQDKLVELVTWECCFSVWLIHICSTTRVRIISCAI